MDQVEGNESINAQLNASQSSQESDLSRSDNTSSDANSSNSRTLSDSPSDTSKSDMNSSTDKSQHEANNECPFDEEEEETALNDNLSADKSSPFHGFSSQEDAPIVSESNMCEGINHEIKQQMFADFGIDNDSEEETENSDFEPEINEKIDSHENSKGEFGALREDSPARMGSESDVNESKCSTNIQSEQCDKAPEKVSEEYDISSGKPSEEPDIEMDTIKMKNSDDIVAKEESEMEVDEPQDENDFKTENNSAREEVTGAKIDERNKVNLNNI